MYKKYRNTKKVCIFGHKHDSTFEADYCVTLSLLVMAGEIKRYEYEKAFSLHAYNGIDAIEVCKHKPDFYVTNNDNSIEVRECKSKGTVTDVWKLKKKWFEVEYPDIPYKIIWKTKL